MKVKHKLLIIICTISTLTGCWDYKDINEKSILLSVGVDYTDKGEIEFIGEIAKLAPSSQKGGDVTGSSQAYTYTSQGEDFEKARADYDSKIPAEDFSGAVRTVVFSQEYAKNGIESYINRVGKLYGYRKTLFVVVSREKPSKIFETKIPNDASIGSSIQNTLTSLSEQGEAIYSNLGEVLYNISVSNSGYILPYIGTEKNTIKYLGYAIMKDSKLIDTVYSQDGLGILLLMADKATFSSRFPNPLSSDDMLSIASKVTKRKITTSYEDGTPVVNINIELDSQLQYQYSYTNPIQKENIKDLEMMVEKSTKEKIIKIIEESQKVYKSDIFQFEKYFRADFPKVYKQINWEQVYPDIEIRVKTKVKLRDLNFLNPKATHNSN